MSAVATLDQLASIRGPQLCVFVGVSTAGSRVHTVFPAWSPLLWPDTELVGLDLPVTTDAETYRRVIRVLVGNPRIRCAVVTTHKLRLFDAVASNHALIATTDSLSTLSREINTLDASERRAFARDPVSLRILLDDLDANRPLLCIGTGGAATALLLAATLDLAATLARGTPVPRRRGQPLTFLDRSAPALRALDQVRRRCHLPADAVRLIHTPDPDAVGQVVSTADAGSVVINATGLGKDAAGSPLPNASQFPPDALAWDFNYRGPLTFLVQAAAGGIPYQDGWQYFVAGWTAALCAVTNRPFTPDLLGQMKAAAAPARPRDAR